MNTAPALIATLAMDAESFAHFNGLRQQHFPPERNFIPAHITLFHQLPGDQESSVRHALTQAARRAPFTMQVSGLWMMGFGVAYRVESAEAVAMRRWLAEGFAPWLSAQDRDFKGHITIQNKVAAGQAKALHAQLLEDFSPRTIAAIGIDLWQYLGGPWQRVVHVPFAP